MNLDGFVILTMWNIIFMGHESVSCFIWSLKTCCFIDENCFFSSSFWMCDRANDDQIYIFVCVFFPITFNTLYLVFYLPFPMDAHSPLIMWYHLTTCRPDKLFSWSHVYVCQYDQSLHTHTHSSANGFPFQFKGSVQNESFSSFSSIFRT